LGSLKERNHSVTLARRRWEDNTKIKFEVLKAAKMLMLIIWVVPPCGFVVKTNVSEEHTATSFRAKYGGRMFVRKVGIYPQVHTTLPPRRPTSTMPIKRNNV
jgi:hypothetical protein